MLWLSVGFGFDHHCRQLNFLLLYFQHHLFLLYLQQWLGFPLA
jgi:hypothetical protein